MKTIILVIVAAIGLATTTQAQITFQAGTQSSIGVPANRVFDGLIDINNDDFEDFIAYNSNGNFELYKNNGNSTFSNVNVGINRNLNGGIINVADFNNDGYQDLVVIYADSIIFYRNTTNNTFVDVTTSLGVSNPSSRQFFLEASKGSWDDYDSDGDLDLIFASKDNSNSYLEVFVNNGTNFSRITIKTYTLPITPILVLLDYDNDNDQDLLVLSFSNTNPPLAQYNYQSVKLYNKSGTSYTDVTSTSGLGLGSNHGFAKIWDYNNDGFADIIMGSTDNVFNSTHVNRVYKNLGNGSFSDVSTTVNVKNGNVYYRGIQVHDFENDGDVDVLYSVSNHLFRNNNNGTFSTDVFSTSGLSSSLVFPGILDINNDGKLDVLNQDLTPYLNTSTAGNFIKIKLFGCPNLKDPRGTRVVLYNSGNIQTRYLVGGDSPYAYYATNSNILNFGIGAATSIDSIKVFWANGGTSIIYSAVINSMNHIYQTSACMNSGSANCLATIYDTVTTHITVYDTVLVSVTDTLIINAILTGLNPPNNTNVFKIFPNPTNDHITIDNGNIANLTGYQIKITNSLSQQVFQSAITQQQFYVDLSTWTGNGIYFVHIIDGQGNTIDIKKIVLQ
jgi:hypothetical protein